MMFIFPVVYHNGHRAVVVHSHNFPRGRPIANAFSLPSHEFSLLGRFWKSENRIGIVNVLQSLYNENLYKRIYLKWRRFEKCKSKKV